jgi:hypothetical protein
MDSGIIETKDKKKDTGRARLVQTECTMNNGNGTTNAENDKEI